jgi:hypothetical protein
MLLAARTAEPVLLRDRVTESYASAGHPKRSGLTLSRERILDVPCVETIYMTLYARGAVGETDRVFSNTATAPTRPPSPSTAGVTERRCAPADVNDRTPARRTPARPSFTLQSAESRSGR